MHRTPLAILLLAIAALTISCSAAPTSPATGRIKVHDHALNVCVDSLGDTLYLSGFTTQGGRC